MSVNLQVRAAEAEGRQGELQVTASDVGNLVTGLPTVQMQDDSAIR